MCHGCNHASDNAIDPMPSCSLKCTCCSSVPWGFKNWQHLPFGRLKKNGQVRLPSNFKGVGHFNENAIDPMPLVVVAVCRGTSSNFQCLQYKHLGRFYAIDPMPLQCLDHLYGVWKGCNACDGCNTSTLVVCRKMANWDVLDHLHGVWKGCNQATTNKSHLHSPKCSISSSVPRKIRNLPNNFQKINKNKFKLKTIRECK